ncbi:MAG: VCBS repeat-containing protein, partial [Fretibacterium sp.]|nr:VCBS repeat-containing protein [Fretibacterium sp.]
ASLFLVEKKPGKENDETPPTFTRVGSAIKKTVGNSANGLTYVTDAKAGLRVDRERTDEELFVVAAITNARLGSGYGKGRSCNAYLTFFRLKEDEEGKAAFSDVSELSVKLDRSLPYTPAQIAVGDFTGTGLKNQVALVTSSNEGVWLNIYTIREQSGGTLTAEKAAEEKVYAYKGGQLLESSNSSFDGFSMAPVVDVAAGDFDGDGKTELAVVYKSNETSVKDNTGIYGMTGLAKGSAVVKVYKWSNGAFRSQSLTKDWNRFDSYVTVPDVSKSVAWLKPVTADLDGDGKDELAVVVGIWQFRSGSSVKSLKTFLCLTFWACERGSILPVFKGPEINMDTIGNSRFDSMEPSGYANTLVFTAYPYYHKCVSVAAGPFRGAMGKYRPRDDVAVSVYDPSATAPTSNHLMWPENDKFTSLKSKKSQSDLSYTESIGTGLAGADFLREGAELGEVRHLVVMDRRSCAAIIQAPPYHFDAIPIPWEDNSESSTVEATNFNYELEAKSVYARSGSTSTAKDVTFESKTSLEGIQQLGIMVNSKTIKKIKEGVKLAAFYAPGIAASAKAAKELVGKYVPDEVFKNLTDTVTTTTKKVDSSAKSVSYTNSISAMRRDAQFFYSTDVHVWRYPIKRPIPAWLLGALESGSKNAAAASGDIFLTVTAPDQPTSSTSKSQRETRLSQTDFHPLYQPRHEEGNLFSYPTTLSSIPGYMQRQFRLLPNVVRPISYGENSEKYEATLKTENGESTSTSKEVEYGTISKVIGTVKSLRGLSDDLTPPEKPETFTKKFGNAETLEVVYPSAKKAFDWNHVTFSSQFDMYVDEGGTMTLGYAVTDLPETAKLWGKDSVYRKYPDPALVMPDRFVFAAATKQVLVRTERDAMRMRGLRVFCNSTGVYTNGTVYPGLSFDIEVPIYNASFLPENGSMDVPVTLYYRKSGDNGTGKKIGDDTVHLSGWKAGSDGHRTAAHFTWEEVPDLDKGLYEFYVVIDPENKIKEVHEAWSKTVPGGNNTGYFPFGVHYGQEYAKTKISEKDFGIKFKSSDGKELKSKLPKAASAAADDDWWSGDTYTDWESDTDLTDFVSGDTEFVFNITYQDEDLLDEAWVDVLLDMKEDGEEYTLCVLSDMIPALASGDVLSLSFNLSEEELQNGRNLRMVITDDEDSVEISLDGDSSSSSGGGCDTGLGCLAFLALAGGALALRRGARK